MSFSVAVRTNTMNTQPKAQLGVLALGFQS